MSRTCELALPAFMCPMGSQRFVLPEATISVSFQLAEPLLHPKVEPAVTTDRAPDCSLPVSKILMRLIPRPIALILPVALSLGLAGCHSAAEKANAYEAQYDRMVSVGAYPAALISIRKAISYDDTNARRFIKLAELQMQLGQPAGAASAFQAALDLEPDNIEALENLSILAVRGGQFDAAQRYIDPLLSLNPDDPAGLLASGAIALSQRKFKEGAALSDRIIAALPDRPDGYVLKARALDGLGRTREAIDMLEKRTAVAEDPRDLLFQIMAFYRRMGDMQGIRATAIRMMPLFPDDPRYAFEAARAYAAEGKTDKVREIIDGLPQHFPNNIDVLTAIGNFWRDTESAETARAELLKYANNAPPRVRSALADQLIDLGDPQNALRLLGSLAPATVTSRNVDAQTHYARALLVTGQTQPAKAKVDAVLAFDQDNADALLLRARLKLLAKDYRGAFTDAQLVANDDDGNEEAALLAAQIYAAQGNQVLAAGAFGNVRQKFPDSSNALQAEVDWLLSQNRTEEAAQRAVSFYHAHPRSGPAKTTYIATCKKTRAAACRVGKPSVAKMLGL
jgi:tetratricopeptide (TPR) repeat protein